MLLINIFPKPMEPDQKYICYIVTNSRNVFTDETRSEYLIKLFSNPEILHIDLSDFEADSEDIFDICEGLKIRSELMDGDTEIKPLKYIDLSNSNLTENDILTMYKFIQKYKVCVNNLMLRIGFHLSEEFYDDLSRYAPSVGAQGMRTYY